MRERIYRMTGEENIATPTLVYYKDLIEENIQKGVGIAGDVNRLWSHIKTHKCACLVRLMLSYGIRACLKNNKTRQSNKIAIEA